MKNVMILGTDEAESENIREIIKEMGESKIYVINKIQNAYQIAMERNIDLFVVDVTAGEKRTIDVAGMVFISNLRELQQYYFTPVIFLSSLEDAKMYAYSILNCYGYVERPYNEEKLKELIKKALTFPGVERKMEYVFFRNKGIFYYFRKAEIIYIENIQRKVWIHTVDRDVELSYITCQQILNHLNSEQFLQCSKNTIVNMAFIQNIDYTNRYLEISDKNIKIEIGSVMVKQFRKKVKGYFDSENLVNRKESWSCETGTRMGRQITF